MDLINSKEAAQNEYKRWLTAYAQATNKRDQLAALGQLAQARQALDQAESLSVNTGPRGMDTKADVLHEGGAATMYNLAPTAANIDRVVGPSFNQMTQNGGRYFSPYEQYQIAKYGGIMDEVASEPRAPRMAPMSAPSAPEPDLPRTNWYSAGTNVGLPAFGSGPQQSEGDRMYADMQARQRAEAFTPPANTQPLGPGEIQGYGTYQPAQSYSPMPMEGPFAGGYQQPQLDVTDYSKYYEQGW